MSKEKRKIPGSVPGLNLDTIKQTSKSNITAKEEDNPNSINFEEERKGKSLKDMFAAREQKNAEPTRQISLKIPESLYQKMEAARKEKNLSKTDYILTAVEFIT